MTNAEKTHFILVLANAVVFFWSGWFEMYQWLLTVDITYISVGLLAGYAVLILLLRRELHSHKSKREKFQTFWYLAGKMPALGLLGTAIGLMYGINAMTGLDLNVQDPKQVLELFRQMLMALGTALVTTIVGLIAGLLLQAQILILDVIHKNESTR